MLTRDIKWVWNINRVGLGIEYERVLKSLSGFQLHSFNVCLMYVMYQRFLNRMRVWVLFVPSSVHTPEPLIFSESESYLKN